MLLDTEGVNMARISQRSSIATFKRGSHSPATAFTWHPPLICYLPVPINIWICNLKFVDLSLPQLGKDILFTI